MLALMDWSWQGLAQRALEFPGGEATSVSPELRARIRYNAVKNQLEASLDGAPYGPLAINSGEGPLAQADWFVNALTGDDANDGATSATALRTFAEWSSRIGGGRATVAMTVDIETDLTEDEFVIDGTFPLTLTVRGTRTVLRSGTISAVQDWDLSLSPIDEGQITDATLPADWVDSGPGGTSLIGKMIVLTSGAGAGAQGWLLKDLGAKVARTSRLLNTATFGVADPVVTDGYDVVDLTALNGTVVVDHGAAAGSGSVILRDLWCRGDGGFGRGMAANASNLVVNGCIIAGFGSDISGTGDGAITLLTPFFDTRAGAAIRLVQDARMLILACGGFGAPSPRFGAQVLMSFINCSQYPAGGSMAPDLDIRSGARGVVFAFGEGAWGTFDNPFASGGAVILGSGAELELETGPTKVWTLGQTLGHGVWIDSGGACYWPSGDTAALHFDFSTAVEEFDIATTVFTVAALGATGEFNPSGRGAAAVPSQVFPP